MGDVSCRYPLVEGKEKPSPFLTRMGELTTMKTIIWNKNYSKMIQKYVISSLV
jgi:hypothetical protein